MKVLGLGAPIIDHVIEITDEFLRSLPGRKGGMELIDEKTLSLILEHEKASPIITTPGGSAANTIRGIAHLGHACGFAGVIGKDAAGNVFADSLAHLNIQSHLAHREVPTSQALCLVTPDKERTMRTFLGASREMTPDDLNPQWFKNLSLVHIEGYAVLNKPVLMRALEYAQKAQAKISFDLGSFEVVRDNKSVVLEILENYVDLVFGNQEEVMALTGQSPETAIHTLGKLCETTVILMGAQGCMASQYKRCIACPAVQVPVVDTTGAGDTFISGFLHGYLDRQPLEKCAYFGTVTGAAIVQVRGVCLLDNQWSEIQAEINAKTQA